MLIITNNPLVREKVKNVLYVEGTFLHVLTKTRDKIFLGHKLITHPLNASIKMMFSPYRSVVISKSSESFNEDHAIIIENSISTYNKIIASRKTDILHNEDYKTLDFELIPLECINYEKEVI